MRLKANFKYSLLKGEGVILFEENGTSTLWSGVYEYLIPLLDGSKSIKDPTIEILKSFVNQIIDSQMFEKQFSNSNITLAEIEKVKEVLINKLINTYHLRVKYPK